MVGDSNDGAPGLPTKGSPGGTVPFRPTFLEGWLLSNCLEQFEQRLKAHWLDVVVVEPRLLLTLTVCLTWRIDRQRTQHHRLKFRLLSQTLCDLIAVHARQADVQQHHVG